MDYDVFISHSSKDDKVAEKLYSFIKSNGLKPWIDTHDIMPSVPYARAIIQGIESSKVMVVILSENANMSENITNEIDNAHRLNKLIFPFLIDNAEFTPELNYYLSRKQWIKAYPNAESHFSELLSAIKAQIRKAINEKIDEGGNAKPTEVKRTKSAEKEGIIASAIHKNKHKLRIGCSISIVLMVIVAFFIPYLNYSEYSPAPSSVPNVEHDVMSSSRQDSEEFEAIDLGLPSGTMWANMNVGAGNSTASGNKYSWGEIRIKSTYVEGQYDYSITKDLKSDKGYQCISGSNYDVAMLTYGKGWTIPTSTQFQELIKYCTWTWIKKNGANGYEIKGRNGNSIFLPAAGWICSGKAEHENHFGYYWCGDNSGNKERFAKEVIFTSTSKIIGDGYRYYGRSVRAVRSK